MKTIKTIVLVFVSIQAFAQNNTSANYDCPTSSFANSELFMNFINSNKLDSAELVLDDWIQKCGLREVIVRAKVLLEFKRDDAILIDKNMFHHLVQFIQRDTISENNQMYHYEYNRPYYCYIPISQDYDKFTKSQYQNFDRRDSKEEELIRKVYSGNHGNFFSDVQSNELQNSSVQNSYLEHVKKFINIPEGHYSIFTGLWVPLKNTTLGPHPEIGFQLGTKLSKWNYDLTILFRFLKSKHEYEVLRKQTNQFETSSKFFGGYMGVECGYDFVSDKSNEFQLFTGIGFDGFDALEESGDLKAVSTFSYNFNFGLKYRKYVNSNAYFGAMLRYNIVDYNLGNKVNFNEFPISLNIIYGFVGNRLKSRNLNYVNYKVRE